MTTTYSSQLNDAPRNGNVPMTQTMGMPCRQDLSMLMATLVMSVSTDKMQLPCFCHREPTRAKTTTQHRKTKTHRKTKKARRELVSTGRVTRARLRNGGFACGRFTVM
jgi:hypothetical protein